MDATPLPGWHSIRPWTRRLSLSIREITSVSATFILSSPLTRTESEPSLVSLSVIADEDDQENVDNELSGKEKPKVVSDALAKGLFASVNSSPWDRVIWQLDENHDEAVIIIFGLLPGRQYDIDLSLVRGGNIRQRVTTEGQANGNVPVSQDGEIEMDTAVPDPHPSSSPCPSNSATSATPSVGEPHSETGGTCTEDDHLKQLQQDLSAIIADRDSLTASLKTARRDAQKADAALRSEIEALKRSSEKHSAAEHRGRQKVLALQEAVKRAQAATSEMENIAKEVEAALPLLMAEQDKKGHVYDINQSEVDRAKEEWHRESQTDRKRVDDLKGELAGLTNKLERLHGKKDRLENGLLPKLDEQLRFIEMEFQQVEPILLASGVSPDARDPMPDDIESVGGHLAGGINADQAMFPSLYHPSLHHPVQRQRHKSQESPGTIGRPALIPVQRPSSLNQQSWASTLASHGARPPVSPQPLNSSLRPLILRPSVQPQGVVGPSSHPVTPNPSSPIAPFVPTSTLSSRAPVFEPSPSITHSLRTAASIGPATVPAVSYPIPVYHPKPSAVSRVVGKGNTKWANGQNFSKLAHQKQQGS